MTEGLGATVDVDEISRAVPTAAQQPDWPDPVAAARACSQLAASPPLVTAAQVRRLSTVLRRVAARRAFVLQAGDCAEPFGAQALFAAGEKYRLLAHMATTISARLGVPVVTVGRIAGQFAKPRSSATEIAEGRELPAFRGLLVNSPEPDPAGRVADPLRMLAGYRTAAMVLAELDRLAVQSTAGPGPFGETYRLADGSWTHRGLWTSHEALVLDYEKPFSRLDPASGERFLLSTHLPWIGERTRGFDGEHVAMLAAVANPVAVKLGPRARQDEVLDLCDRLNPAGEPGRLTLICRMGADEIRKALPPLVDTVRRSGRAVIWMCDPMHGNTKRTAAGNKTRWWQDITAELDAFTDIVAGAGCWPGGVHLEVTGRDVTECLADPADDAMPRYESLCDPRLNRVQSVLLAELLAERLGALGGAA
jgi:3-deoxy-7-phosphoheptulonate synthase